MSYFEKIRGTAEAIFGIGLGTTRVNLKNGSGTQVEMRNAGDTAYVGTKQSFVDIQDSNGQRMRLSVPDIGSDYELVFPADDGTPSQVLQTNGSGVLSWVTLAGGADKLSIDTTSLAFGTGSPLTMFTTPSGAVIDYVEVVVDTAFDGTAPTVTVGITGTTSKYTGTTDVDLKTAGSYRIYPGLPSTAGEPLIATYVADSSAAGAARILVAYSVPA